jgi:hypothetical protein
MQVPRAATLPFALTSAARRTPCGPCASSRVCLGGEPHWRTYVPAPRAQLGRAAPRRPQRAGCAPPSRQPELAVASPAPGSPLGSFWGDESSGLKTSCPSRSPLGSSDTVDAGEPPSDARRPSAAIAAAGPSIAASLVSELRPDLPGIAQTALQRSAGVSGGGADVGAAGAARHGATSTTAAAASNAAGAMAGNPAAAPLTEAGLGFWRKRWTMVLMCFAAFMLW